MDLLGHLTSILQGWPPEALWPLMLVVCFGSALAMYRWFGEAGLYAYIVLAILGANIQVLKVVKFGLYPEPVALGTVLFSSSFLATDILAEHHGPASARKAVWLGFVSYLVFTVFMLLTMGFRPLSPEEAGADMAWALPYHDHISAIFSRSPALLAAGMIAYLASQFHDVWLFERLKIAFQGRRLWLRNNVSTAISALIDNLIFSVCAWILFAPEPLPWKTVLLVYVLGTYWLRLLVALLDTPFLYLARRLRPDQGLPEGTAEAA